MFVFLSADADVVSTTGAHKTPMAALKNDDDDDDKKVVSLSDRFVAALCVCVS